MSGHILNSRNFVQDPENPFCLIDSASEWFHQTWKREKGKNIYYLIELFHIFNSTNLMIFKSIFNLSFLKLPSDLILKKLSFSSLPSKHSVTRNSWMKTISPTFNNPPPPFYPSPPYPIPSVSPLPIPTHSQDGLKCQVLCPSCFSFLFIRCCEKPVLQCIYTVYKRLT